MKESKISETIMNFTTIWNEYQQLLKQFSSSFHLEIPETLSMTVSKPF